MKHKSVLLEESINGLNIKEDGVYVDATLGFGGHSLEILKRINKGFLFAFDQDSEAIMYSQERLSDYHNFKIIKSNFSNMKQCLAEENITHVDGILFDIGVSSMQLDEDYRGFSYHQDAKLDMRMDIDQSFSAYDVVNTYDYNNLVRILREYGEETYATSIARNIIKSREEKPIETTFQLVDIIKKSMPMKAMRDSHPARKTFQAIRIEVNHELDVLKSALEQAIELLNVGGRLCVITFHSLEDRIVKTTFKKYSEVDSKFSKLPYVPEEYQPKIKIISKGIIPSKEELEENNRARSSRLRIIEKIKETGEFKEVYLGIQGYDKEMISSIDSTIRFNKGIYVYDVERNSPAEKSGIEENDILLSIQDEEINTMCEMREKLYKRNIGDKVAITLIRNSIPMSIEVELAEKT